MQVAVLHLYLKLIQWARRRAGDDISNDIKMPIVTRTDVMLQVRMPGYPTAQVSADIREHPDLLICLAKDKNAITIDGFLPTVNGGAREIKSSRDTEGIVFQFSQGDPFAFLEFVHRRTEQIADSWKADERRHDGGNESGRQLDKIAPAHMRGRHFYLQRT